MLQKLRVRDIWALQIMISPKSDVRSLVVISLKNSEVRIQERCPEFRLLRLRSAQVRGNRAKSRFNYRLSYPSGETSYAKHPALKCRSFNSVSVAGRSPFWQLTPLFCFDKGIDTFISTLLLGNIEMKLLSSSS
jgi:hypothetical protein